VRIGFLPTFSELARKIEQAPTRAKRAVCPEQSRDRERDAPFGLDLPTINPRDRCEQRCVFIRFVTASDGHSVTKFL
jgi:hypothetical protein